MNEPSLTGIPVEALYGALGTLGLLVYLDLRREIRRLRRESQERSAQLMALTYNVRSLCERVGVRFYYEHNGHDNGSD